MMTHTRISLIKSDEKNEKCHCLVIPRTKIINVYFSLLLVPSVGNSVQVDD